MGWLVDGGTWVCPGVAKAEISLFHKVITPLAVRCFRPVARRLSLWPSDPNEENGGLALLCFFPGRSDRQTTVVGGMGNFPHRKINGQTSDHFVGGIGWLVGRLKIPNLELRFHSGKHPDSRG